VLDLLRESLLNAKIIRVNSYEYIVHPILDGVPAVEPELLEEVVNALFELGEMDCDLIVAPEAMGFPLAAPLSMMSDIPFVAVRKRSYGLEGEVKIDQATGYSNGAMYINGVQEGDQVIVVDDVLSTGSTLKSIVNALRGIGAEVLDVLVVVEKGRHDQLEEELGIKVKSLVRLEVRDGRVVFLD